MSSSHQDASKLAIEQSPLRRKVGLFLLFVGLMPVGSFIALTDQERLFSAPLFTYVILLLLFTLMILVPIRLIFLRKRIVANKEELMITSNLSFSKEKISLQEMEWWRKVGGKEKGPFLMGDMIQIKSGGSKMMISEVGYKDFRLLENFLDENFKAKRRH